MEFQNQAKARAYWQDVQCKALRAGVRSGATDWIGLLEGP